MKKNTIIEKEQKAVKSLQHLGFSRMEAHILIFLFKTDGVTARDIEEGTRLRQPEVSNGASALKNRKWIKTSKIPTKGKGRPHFKYYLAKPKEKILNEIQEELQKRIEEEQQNLVIVREMLMWEQKTL